MTESDADWSDEGAESERSTENEGQDSDGEEGQIDIESPAEEGLSEVDSDFDQDDNTSLIYGVEMTDPVCIKLNDLIRKGKIQIPNSLQIFERCSRNLLRPFTRV